MKFRNNMVSNKSLIFISIICILFASCAKSNNLIAKMQNIKELSNYDLDSAIMLFNSLEVDDSYSDKIQNKYNLLSIRLADKANIIPHDDKHILQLVEYYEAKGNSLEKQEVYYYAGSVYRDLDDTPNALLYFLKSINSTDEYVSPDSLLLRNAYSQLCLLYYNVQDYNNAYMAAKKENEVASRLGILDLCTKLHECVSLVRIDSVAASKKQFAIAFNIMTNDSLHTYSQKELSSLLYHLSHVEMRTEASVCCEILKRNIAPQTYNEDTYLALAEYFKLLSLEDSAVHCYKEILKNKSDLNAKYDASKVLTRIYLEHDDVEKARAYFNLFRQINDSLNLGERQSLAATTNNKYKYQLAKEKEFKLKREKEAYRSFLTLTILITIIITLSSAIFFIINKNRQLKDILTKVHEINLTKGENKKLLTELEHQQYLLCTTKAKLEKNIAELEETKSRLEDSDIELLDVKRQLEMRTEQSKGLIQMLNKTQFEENTENILNKMRLAAQGRCHLTELDWKIFSSAVCQLYPSLPQTIIQHTGKKISNEQLQFCYLMQIGLSNPEIEKITNWSRATVWRWSKKFDWILED